LSRTDIKVDDAADVFGIVTALFVAVAFAGIIYTLLLQRRELRLQRHELQSTRKELSRAATAQEQSEKALRTQSESRLLAAQLNALVARIAACDREIREKRN
jgi:uncharacterized protein HemX